MQILMASIQHCSVHDGPGIRTTLFFKGCNMHCPWCHNPETVWPQPEILEDPSKCIGCGQCETGCFSGAKESCGVFMPVEAVMEEIRLDSPYYGADGGVTISGGEPFVQADALYALLERCKAEGISCALESNLYSSRVDAERLAALCQLVMCDIKLWDSAQHKVFTGQDNAKTLENIRALSAAGLPLIVRTPVIPGVNDTPDEIGSIAAFLSGIPTLLYYELLSYHPLGLSKAKSRHFTAREFVRPTREAMRALGQTAAAAGIPVLIDGIRQ